MGVNKDKIFELFEGDESIKVLDPNAVNTFMKTPYAKIGMFTKLIINHFIFHKKLKKFFEKEGSTYDIDKTKEASEFTIYNRAWYYIKQIDTGSYSHKLAIEDFEPISFNKALQSSIKYFEDKEQYERCAHLLKISKMLEKV